MKERIVRNWKTTFVGILGLLFTVYMIVSKIICAKEIWNDCNYSVLEIGSFLFISYCFIGAKDTLLIEGLSLGFFKKKL